MRRLLLSVCVMLIASTQLSFAANTAVVNDPCVGTELKKCGGLRSKCSILRAEDKRPTCVTDCAKLLTLEKCKQFSHCDWGKDPVSKKMGCMIK